MSDGPESIQSPASRKPLIHYNHVPLHNPLMYHLDPVNMQHHAYSTRLTADQFICSVQSANRAKCTCKGNIRSAKLIGVVGSLPFTHMQQKLQVSICDIQGLRSSIEVGIIYRRSLVRVTGREI